MKQQQHTRMMIPVLAAVAIGCLASPARGGSYSDADFSLRFPAALSRFASYGDVAAVGGASAGSKWSSSRNPASVGWLDLEGKLKVCVSPQYDKLWFDNGTEIDVLAESLTFDANEWGTFLVAAGQISSNEETLRNGYEWEFAGDLDLAQWAR